MLTFKRESIKDCFAELQPLLYAHWKEITHYLDIPLEPDEERYYTLERENVARLYCVRSDIGELVGYAIFFVNYNAHYKSSLQALQDILFIHPKYRGSGGRFILWCDDQLKKEGVQLVVHHIKASHNFGPLLERFGYELIDLIYGRRLDKD